MPKKLKRISKKKGKKSKFNAYLSSEQVLSSAKEAFDLHSRSYFGEVMEKKVYFSLVEALYLLEKQKIEVLEGRRKLSYNSFLEKAKKIEGNFWSRFCAFRELRNRGYIIKTALKFGADFRVYARGDKPGKEHAKWIMFPVYESSNLTWHDFAAKNRVAHSTKKNLLIAIVDEVGDVTYYEIAWKKP